MALLTPALRASLRANAIARASRAHDDAPFDPAPVVTFFNPVGAATWLATEVEDDGDSLFGLADLGFGCPELGRFSLSELANVRLPFGLGIERDIGFASALPLSLWADTARRTGSILSAMQRLGPHEPGRSPLFSESMGSAPDPDPLPPSGPDGG